MGQVWEWLIPLPPRVLAQNTRSHWRKEAPAKREYRRAVVEAIGENKPDHPLASATLTVTARVCRRRLTPDRAGPRYPWFLTQYRAVDEANMIGALKTAIDALIVPIEVPRDVLSRYLPTYASVILDDRSSVLRTQPSDPFFETVSDWGLEGVVFHLESTE